MAAAAATQQQQPGGSAEIDSAPAIPIQAAIGAARLLKIAPGFYAFMLYSAPTSRGTLAGLPLPAIHIVSPPPAPGGFNTADALEITDTSGQNSAWLGGLSGPLFVSSPPDGGAALVTAYHGPGHEVAELALEIRRLDKRVGVRRSLDGVDGVLPEDAAAQISMIGADSVITVLSLEPGTPAGAAAERSQESAAIAMELVVHLRGHGDVRFIGTEWAGCFGRSSWMEAFTVRLPPGFLGIEYKALTSDGTETPWVQAGASCGKTEAKTPLVGFAVRQRPDPAAALLDCEYSGYFQSGITVGPSRNGAPCLSSKSNDPLEGVRLRILPRQPRKGGTRPA